MKLILKIFVALLFFVVGFLLISEWRPEAEQREAFELPSCMVSMPDTLTLVTWNIGYAGLGEGMDFFYDGGERVRCSEEETRANLNAIIVQLKELDYADFILLQEVDFDSSRSYGIDMFEEIRWALDYEYTAKALNYSSVFVPVPILNPLGRVNSGLVTLSRHPMLEAVRRQYPSIPSLPSRLFDLKRCMLSVAIEVGYAETLWLNNTHNTAFDSGDMRSREVEFIGKIIEDLPCSITAGDWNSTPPNYTPSAEALGNRYFSVLQLTMADFPEGVSVAADISKESLRYLDRPYSPEKSVTTLVDFAVLGSKCDLLECKILDLGFKNSDHNPVIITFLHNN